MLNYLKINTKFFRRLTNYKYSKLFGSEDAKKYAQEMQRNTLDESINTMTAFKSIAISFAKIFIFLFLVNLILIKPLSAVISKNLESFDNNPLIKIVSLDFIGNPLTFIRMADYYLAKGDTKKASLYLQYAEVVNARYPSYPKEINTQILELKRAIKDQTR